MVDIFTAGGLLLQDFKLKLKTLERRRLDYDSDRRAFARLDTKRVKSINGGAQPKPEVTTQLQSKEHTMAGTYLPCFLHKA